jgi:hypothetical protein
MFHPAAGSEKRSPPSLTETVMKKLSLLSLVIFITCMSAAQSPTYYADIEPILRKNCIVCHKPGGIGPFSLMTYDEVSAKGKFIAHVTKKKYMPPWRADPTFQSFKNERLLSPAEIGRIQQWVSNGMPKGKKDKNREADEVTGEALRKPDLTLSMMKSFVIPDKAVEEFRFFSIPTGIQEDVYLAAVDFIPGNRKQVHHSRIMVDTTQRIRGIDGLSEKDPKVKTFQTIPLVDEFLYGWAPGNEGISFPPGTGKKLYKGSDLVLNIHYSPSSKQEEDKSLIHFYFARGPVDREVKTLTLRENDITNQPFFIPAGTQPTFYISYKVDRDISLISIMPHMHFLGRSFRALAATPNGDAIPLIKIDDWDFNWQSTYIFKNLLKIPAGSVILVQATYDNTENNAANPNHPIKDVGYGWNTTDEMCNLIIYYVDYREGDENVKN